MVGYHLMGKGHSIKLGSWGVGWGCEPPSRSRAALVGGVELFEKNFEYKP